MTTTTGPGAARALTDHLLSRDRYGGKAVLEQRVEAEIQRMADTIAKEIVAENPELHDVISTRVRELIQKALVDDDLLSGAVVRAVAKSLHQLVAEPDPLDEP